jgi:hypothetical protein
LRCRSATVGGWCHMQGHRRGPGCSWSGGVSGSPLWQERPEGAALWRHCGRGDNRRGGEADRLFRSALDALQPVEDLKRYGGLSLVAAGPSGGHQRQRLVAKPFLTIAAAFAEAERDRIRDSGVTQVKRDQKARRSLPRRQGAPLATGCMEWGSGRGPERAVRVIHGWHGRSVEADAPLRTIQARAGGGVRSAAVAGTPVTSRIVSEQPLAYGLLGSRQVRGHRNTRATPPFELPCPIWEKPAIRVRRRLPDALGHAHARLGAPLGQGGRSC